MKYLAGLTIILCLLLGCIINITAQQKDSLKTTGLNKVVVVSYVSKNGVGHLNEVQPPFIYAGKKTEVILVNSVDASKAINNARQILGRVPGVNIVRSETGGFVANGIGVRGLNPRQQRVMLPGNPTKQRGFKPE